LLSDFDGLFTDNPMTQPTQAIPQGSELTPDIEALAGRKSARAVAA